MPFKSKAQQKYLWAKHPDIAKKWSHEHPNQDISKLPMHKKSDCLKVHEKKDEKVKPSETTDVKKVLMADVNKTEIKPVNMTKAQAFKFGFLLRCMEEGLTLKEAEKRATFASALAAGGSLLGGLASGVALPLAVGGPVALGAGSGLGLAALRRGDASPQDIKTKELIEEYMRLAEEAKQKKLLREQESSGDLMRIA